MECVRTVFPDSDCLARHGLGQKGSLSNRKNKRSDVPRRFYSLIRPSLLDRLHRSWHLHGAWEGESSDNPHSPP